MALPSCPSLCTGLIRGISECQSESVKGHNSALFFTWINAVDIFYYTLLSVDEFRMFLFVFINGDCSF